MLQTARPQSELTTLVESALSSKPHLPRAQVRCYADGGQVTLQGEVSSYFHKQMAQESIRRIDGVQQIENRLQVKWT